MTASGRRLPRAAPAALVAGAVVLAACSDGYPTGDAPSISPFEMTQDQRLAAMNRLGREVAVDQRWSYRLGSDCTLEVVTRPSDPRREALLLPLRESEVSVQFDADAKAYAIRVSVPGRADEPAPVLEAPKWNQAVEMRSLVRALRQGCTAGDAPAADADSGVRRL